MSHTGNRLKEWQRHTGYTVREMGKLLGVSPSHISRVMNGKKSLSKERIIRLNQVRTLEIKIAQRPPDVSILKYELEQLIGGKDGSYKQISQLRPKK